MIKSGWRLRGHREYGRLGSVGMNSFGDQRGAATVEVEIQQANVGRRGSDPVENRVMIINPILRQMPLEPDQREWSLRTASRVPQVSVSRQILTTESGSLGGKFSRAAAFSGSFAVIALISNSVKVGRPASFRLQVVFRRTWGCQDTGSAGFGSAGATKSRCGPGRRCGALPAPATLYCSD